MKRLLSILILTTSLLLSSSYNTEEAIRHIGEIGTICGTAYGGYYARSSNGKPTFINLDGKYPNQKFTIIIWGVDRYKFKNPEEKYTGKRICVKGRIDLYHGTPQIAISKRGQIK